MEATEGYSNGHKVIVNLLLFDDNSSATTTIAPVKGPGMETKIEVMMIIMMTMKLL